ncbi:ralBP1-associated Eps domain-containing protein 1 isoform X2 [Anthonomus grandis grandis]|uniref:ralBP1-associated Eps domain-containing protein 1 isoform X2 n=1 Tax=Anthonomus grandis grandis TaxID=2921223 RepID=UPI002165560F|nr:ralBP1-associated Eps domain-containing protein 1 isoform X2 [Anthonomus grandis grandis]
MEDLHLSEPFLRYFSDVFLCCDEDRSGKASLQRTVDLIKSGNVPEEVIAQISEICWSPGTTCLSKKQFFSALKLVALYQANLPIRSDLIMSKVDLPLPKFTWGPLDAESPVPDLIELRNEPECNTDSISTDSEADSETVRCSPDMSSPASDSPTPTNSVQDRNWAWQGLVSEEQRQLLEESSDKHSSEEDAEVSNEVWVITPEQKDYYTKQFQKLQENPKALLSGSVARTFFERSQLPVQELRKIWQLADVTKDGALSLPEFYTAMHLVVLRKHKIAIPDVLPATLVPINKPPSPEVNSEPVVTVQPKEVVKEWTKFADSPTSSNVSSPGIKPVNFDFQIDQNDPDLRHPVARRLTPEVVSQIVAEDVPDAIDLSSPKKAPDVNNLQVSQVSSLSQQNSAIQRPQPKKVNPRGPGAIPPPPDEGGPVSLPAFSAPAKKEKPPPPPPPRPFKTHGRSSSLDLNRLTKASAPPPVVPPRVSPSNHSRKLIIQKSEQNNGTTYAHDNFADFDQFEQYENVQENCIFPGDVYEAERKKLFDKLFKESTDEAPKKHGAFEVYRKPGSDKTSTQCPDTLEEEQWEEIEKLQVENAALLRICQELSQELADLKQEKLKMKVKLERLQAKAPNGG